MRESTGYRSVFDVPQNETLRVLEMKPDQPLAEALNEIVPPGNAADFHNTSGWMKTKR